jgi:hypothetical protein
LLFIHFCCQLGSSLTTDCMPLHGAKGVRMAGWLDDLVSKTKQRYEEQSSKDQKLLEEQRLKKALGARFFNDLSEWLRINTDKFNQKFESQVFSVNEEGAQHVINLISHPDPIHMWSARIQYAPDLHGINILRNPGSSSNYTLALTKDGSSIVALYGNNTDAGRALDVNLLGQDIMHSMLIA